ncbi:hypothetical protein FO519_006076 [Halicephalobus sp. NKZ332]|nr:hypothetical protein FO519_006076 [Halicephalobus sp. NKZ332]
MHFIPWVLALLGSTIVLAGEYDLTVEVAAGKFQCFYQPVTDVRHKTMEVDYQVIDGADLNINFMVLFGADVLIQETMKTDGSHKIELKQLGDYQVCFDNTFSIQSRKIVFFEIFLMDENGNVEDTDIASFGHNDANFAERMQQIGITISEFHASFNRIKASLNKVEYHQSILRAYEARDRAIMNANFDRVSFWSLLNSIILIGVGVLQDLMDLSYLLCFSIVLAFVSGQQEEFILAVVVDPGKIECFFQDLTNPKHVAFEVDYQVTDGGEHDINFFIRNPSGVNVVRDERKTDANHRIDVLQNGRGDYAVCFDNSFSIQTKKTVFMEMYLLDEKGNYLNSYDVFADNNKARQMLSMQLSDFDRITTKVKSNLNRIEQLQAQLRAVESRDRSTMESNFERVNRWSVINLFVMLFVSGIQLYLIRTLFEDNSKVGKFIRSGKLN